MLDIVGPTGQQTILDDTGAPITVQNYGVADVVAPAGTAYDPPVISGGQFAGDVQTVTDGSVTNVTARRWMRSDDGVIFTEVPGETGTTWTLPAAWATTAYYCIELDGDVGGVTATYRSPIKMVYLPMPMRIMQLYSMDEMAAHKDLDNYALQMVDHDQATLVFTGEGVASDPNNYVQKRAPAAGDKILVPFGAHMIWDYELSPRLHKMRIDGEFSASMAGNENLVLLIETRFVSRTGYCHIGTDADNRLPETSTFEVRYSDRDPTISMTEATDIDVANDQLLMSRGLVNHGRYEIWAQKRTHWAWTAPDSLPLEGDTSISLVAVPADWEVGMSICVPTTAWAPTEDQSVYRMTEYREISAIDRVNNTVSFVQPLAFPHDSWRDPDPRDPQITSSLAELTIPICLMDRQVNKVSEGADETTPPHRRGHEMHAHWYIDVDTDYVGYRFMGRTNKQAPAGTIKEGQFLKRVGQDEVAFEPITASSNRIGRYPLHFHEGDPNCGPVNRPTVRGCVFEGNAGHGLVFHGSDGDVLSSFATRCTGAAFVWENGWEQGWAVDCFSTDFYKDPGPDNQNFVGAMKSSVGKQGDQVGDVGTQLAGGYFGGRAVVTRRFGTSGAQFGGMWNARYIAEKLNPASPGGGMISFRKDMPRSISNLPRLASQDLGDIPNQHLPLFTRDFFGFGCQQVQSVLKRGGKNGHDFQSVFEHSYGFNNEDIHNMNYIALYLFSNTDGVAAGFGRFMTDLPNIQKQPKGTKITGGGRVERIRWVNTRGRGADIGINASGGYLAHANNNQFSKISPRFVIVNNDLTDNFSNIETPTENLNDTQNLIPTEDVTIIGATNGYQPLEIDAPRIIGTFGEGNINQITNPQFGTKKCSFNLIPEVAAIAPVSPLPSEFATGTEDTKDVADHHGFFGSWTEKTIRDIAAQDGYWTDQDGKNLVFLYHHNSAVLDEELMVFTRAVEIHPDYTIPSGWVNNGTITLSDVAPTADNFSVTVTQGTPQTFDVLALSNAATTAFGATLALLDFDYRRPTLCTIGFDTAAGTITLYPFEGVGGGEDHTYVTITDGQESYKTIRIDITVNEAV